MASVSNLFYPCSIKTNKMKFKSDINCQNCVAKVKNTLDGLVSENAWKVDTENPAKILEVTNLEISAQYIINKLKRIGFTAEEID